MTVLTSLLEVRRACTNRPHAATRAALTTDHRISRHFAQNAASVAGLLITTEATIAELPEDKSAAPAMPGGMGGMGGMDF